MKTPHPKKFALRLKELPLSFGEDVRRFSRDYIAPIVINDSPLGSGTLVRIDDHFGMLTAQHVVCHPKRPDLRLSTTSPSGPILTTTVAEFPHCLTMPAHALRIVTSGDPKSDEFGPDLAFIALPPSGMLSELKARRSFYNLTINTSAKLAAAKDPDGFASFCGYPRSRDYSGPAELGFDKTLGLAGYAFMTGVEKYQVKNGWDYIELGVKHEELKDFGPSFGGVSGGGVWKIPVYRKRNEPPGKEYFEKMAFAGVAFYEEDHGVGSRFFVRAHGPESIFKKFLPYVREKLGAEKTP